MTIRLVPRYTVISKKKEATILLYLFHPTSSLNYFVVRFYSRRLALCFPSPPTQCIFATAKEYLFSGSKIKMTNLTCFFGASRSNYLFKLRLHKHHLFIVNASNTQIPNPSKIEKTLLDINQNITG